MKPLAKTIRFMMTYSLVNFILVISIIVFFTLIQILLTRDINASPQSNMGLIAINLMTSVFIGTYLGGALNNLKQYYLWKINQHYRTTLMTAFLIFIGVFSLVQMPLLYQKLNHSWLLLSVPFCVSIFASFMVLGKNVLQKILIPAVPFGLYQLHKLDISTNTIIILLNLATLGLIVAMFKDRFYPERSKQLSDQNKVKNSMVGTATGLNIESVTAFNYSLGILISPLIRQSKRNIDWAITMPHTKLSLFSILYVLLIMLFVSIGINMNEEKPLVELFTIMFLSSSLISIVMETRQLIRQTRTFVHVFNGNNHRQMRNKILRTLDKTFVINSLVFIAGIYLFSSLLSISINSNYLNFSFLAVISISMAFYPILLCVSWINISFKLLALVTGYAFSVYLVVTWLGAHAEVFDSLLPLLFFVMIISLRVVTQNIFWNYPMESLMKNK